MKLQTKTLYSGLTCLFIIFNICTHAQTNTAKPVGILEGNAGTSPDGAANYTVPVKVTPGINGMQPALALIYNSRTTDGLAGWGWNISGISSISRGNQTSYYNGITAPLKMNAEDNFYLDGQLLIPVTGTNGGNGTVYETESKNFSKIESFGSVNGDPEWWKVTDKNGMVTEYGKQTNDRLRATANFSWFVSSVKDVSDNTITYNYANSGNEIVLNTIDYANNAQVVFEYETKENPNVTFVNGTGFKNTKLLKNIIINANSTRQITYKLNHTVQIKRNYLTSIDLTGTDNTSFVTTNFNYGNPANEENISLQTGTYQNNYSNVILTPGDYNNDGKTDIVAMERKGNVNGDGTGLESTTSSGYNLFTNIGVRPSGSIESSRYELNKTYPEAIYSSPDFTPPYNLYNADFEGSGRDGLLMPIRKKHSYPDSKGAMHEDGMNFTDNITKDNFNSAGGTMTVTSSQIPLPNSLGNTYNFYLKESNSFVQGDFDGNGKSDIISILGQKVKTGETIEKKRDCFFCGWYVYRVTPIYSYYYKAFFTNTSDGYTNSEIWGIGDEVKDAKAVYPIDFDGDGKQEIIVFKPFNYIIYSINRIPSSSGYSFQATQILTGWDIYYNGYKKLLLGDFNGDRKTDIIGIGASQTANIFYSTGTNFLTGNFELDRKPDFSTVWYDFFTTGDFNGDGITDLFHSYSFPVTFGGTTTYYPKQSVHYFKGANYTPPSSSRVNAYVCARELSQSSYPDYTILGTNYSNCPYTEIDPYDGREYTGYEDQYFIEYTQTTPTYCTPVFTKGASYHSGMVANMVYGSQPEVGDFDGDGKTDILQSTSYNGYVIIYPFGSDLKSSLLHTVTDGFGNEIKFDYQSVAEKTQTPLYTTTGQLTSAYPINVMAVPLKVVKAVTRPNGIGGEQTTTYKYEDLVLDRQRGFLGFVKTTEENATLNTKAENQNQLNTQYRLLLPQTGKSYINNTQVAESQTSFIIATVPVTSTRNYTSFLRLNLLPQNKTEINKLSNAAVKTEYSYDDHNNLTSQTVKTGAWSGADVTPTETSVTTTSYIQTGKALVPVFPDRIQVSNTRNGSTTSTIATIAYTADRGLPQTKTNRAETPLAATQTFVYDSYGNATQITTSVPGQPDAVSVITYDGEHKFALKTVTTVGAVSKTTSATYNTFWGLPLTQTEGDGNAGSLTTSYAYDALGKRTTTTTPLGLQIAEQDVWDVSGQQTFYHFTDYPDGADTKEWYDKLGRVIKKQKLGWNNQWVTETVAYNSKGQTESAIAPYYSGEPQLTTTTQYDLLGRVERVTSPNGITSISYSFAGNGSATVTTVNPAGQTSNKTTDATGKTISTTDNGGTVNFTYDEKGNLKTNMVNGITMQTISYDSYGRKTQMADANAGTTTYEYNGADLLTKQTDANGAITTLVYDAAGRIASRTTAEGTTLYEYYNTANNHELKKISNANHSKEWQYDNYGRPTSLTETITGKGTYTNTYSYNSNGLPQTVNYPNGVQVNYNYTNTGMLYKKMYGTKTLYEALGYNGLGQVTAYKTVDNKTTTISYDKGLVTGYSTPGVQNMEYTFSPASGNLTQRKDVLRNLTEVFTYDGLNRLLTATVNGTQQFGITYDGNGTSSLGNIINKSDAGTYVYRNDKPHATAYISPVSASFTQPQNTDYNFGIQYSSFQRPLQITKGTSTLQLKYGVDDERIQTTQTAGGQTEERLFLGAYEKQTVGNTINDIIYIDGDAGTAAMIVNNTVYAVYTDYLGSILKVYNEAGSLVAEQNFDAWGRKRNPANWNEYLSPSGGGGGGSPEWLYRGYTGHEHLAVFGLVNMNARLYDPLTGRMLSPDNYVQAADYTQSYNRYAYCVNNPLKYRDPDGNWFVIDDAIAAGAGFVFGYVSHGISTGNWGWKAVASGGIGALTAWVGLNTFGLGTAGIAASGIQSSTWSFVGSMAINTAISQFMPPVTVPIGNFYISLSIGVGLGSSGLIGGANIGFGYHDKDWSLAVGFGFSSNSTSWGGSFSYGGIGGGYYQTHYGDAIGPDGKPNNQTVGGISILINDFSFRLENDFLGDGHDRWRSNAVEIGIGKFVIGTTLYNNDPQGEGQEVKNYTNRLGNFNKGTFKAWANGKVYSSPLWGGIKNGNNIVRLGYSHPMFQDRTQNWVHRNGFFYLPVGHQNYYVDYSEFSYGSYFYSGYYNPYSLW